MTAPSEIDVSILIVSYNTRALALAALSSAVAATSRPSYEIIIVDNASHDGSAAALAQHQAKPRVIALNENIGFGRANNLAAQQARGRYILLLNPDTVVLDGAIDALVEFADANPDATIWGGRTLFEDGRLNPASCWGRMTLWNQICRVSGLTSIFSNTEFFNGEAYGGWDHESVRRVDIVSGCFFLIGRDTWNSLGGFDPHFFMYGEEADLCLRAQALGARPKVTPAATIIHLGGASETARTGKMIKLLSAKASLIGRHWHPALAPIGQGLQALWPLSRAIALTLASTITRSQAQRDAARTWTEIWTQRQQWRHGYPVHDLGPDLSPVANTGTMPAASAAALDTAA